LKYLLSKMETFELFILMETPPATNVVHTKVLQFLYLPVVVSSNPWITSALSAQPSLKTIFRIANHCDST
jgi:Mrp family chromosome partitioning ATPase